MKYGSTISQPPQALLSFRHDDFRRRLHHLKVVPQNFSVDCRTESIQITPLSYAKLFTAAMSIQGMLSNFGRFYSESIENKNMFLKTVFEILHNA